MDTVLAKYFKFKTAGKTGRLAVKLAREAFIGDAALVKCTMHGSRGLPGAGAR